MWVFITLTLLLLFLLLCLCHRFNRSTRLMNKIPGPYAWPIIGNSLNYILPPEQMFYFQRKITKKYGDVNQIYGFNLRMVNISNPNDVEKIFSSPSFNEKQHPYKYLEEWLGEGLLLSNGNKWHQRRKMLTKTFHFNILRKFMVTFVEGAEEFLKKVQKEVNNKQTNLFPLVSNSTLKIMCETSMGVSMQDEIQTTIDPYFKSLQIIGDCFTKRLGRAWLHFNSIFNLTSISKIQNIAVVDLHNLTNRVINDRRNYLHDNKNLLDDSDKKTAMLDKLLISEKEGLIDNDGIREEVDTFMFEGHDTTAVALTFIIMALANEPEIQDKIFEEMDKIFGDSKRLPTIEDTNEMKYLECCIKEGMRLYPSVPVIARWLTKDTVLGGYTVPAKTSCLIMIYDLHRRPELFPEPERFIPERFLPENCIKRHPYAYVPFSAGSRNCIGQKFAFLEMKSILSGLFRKFRLEPVTKPSDIVYKNNMVLRTTQPVYARFCTRT